MSILPDPRPHPDWKKLPVGFQEMVFTQAFPVIWSQTTLGDQPIERVHAHNVLELGYCWEGSGVFVVEGAMHAYRAGDCSVIRRNDCHLARSEEGGISRWTFIFLEPGRLIGDPGYAGELLRSDTLGGRDFPNVLRSDRHPGICSLLRELARELNEGAAGYEASAKGLVAGLMPMLHRLEGREEPREPGADRSFARIAPALERMARELAEDLRIEDLARSCDLSPAHFRRLFQEAVGESPKQYLIRYRVHQAAAMLEHRGRAITDIAFTCGFQTLSSFNRHFRALLGCAPRDWRKGLRPG